MHRLHDEAIVVKWVVADHESPDIAYNFESEANDHAHHIAPCPVISAEAQLGKNEDGKVDCQGEIASCAGEVVEREALGETACLCRALIARDGVVASCVDVGRHD